MSDCLFCKIIAGDIPSNKLYEDAQCYAFHDIDPKAPVHFLVIPKAHITGIDRLDDATSPVVGHIFGVIAKLTAELGCANGFRVVSNCGEDGGQTVGHLHFHVLAGRSLAWPPG